MEIVEYQHRHGCRYKFISCNIQLYTNTSVHFKYSTVPTLQSRSAVQNMNERVSEWEATLWKEYPHRLQGPQKWLEIDVPKAAVRTHQPHSSLYLHQLALVISSTDASPLSPVDQLLWRAPLLSPCVHPASLSFGELGQRDRRRWRRDPAVPDGRGAPWRPSPSGDRPPERWNKQWWWVRGKKTKLSLPVSPLFMSFQLCLL